MSRYIKLEDAIKAYNQAVKKLVEYEMEEFDLGDFTECQFDTTQIKLIARMIYSLPTIEVSEDCISREWLLNYTHAEDVGTPDEMWKPAREWVNAIKNAPSVVSKTQIETQNSNENSNVISVYDGVSEAVRCAMCSNPNKSNRGCDGACSYDEKLYKRIIDAIDIGLLVELPSVVPTCQKNRQVERKEGESEWYDYCPNCGAKMKGAE